MADRVSAEANMIRDELRHAIRGLDTAAQRMVDALVHAESFLRDERRPSGVTTVRPLRTPAAYFEPAPTQPSPTELRED